MTAEECLKGLTYLGVAYGKALTKEECSVYYDFLKGFSFEALKKAVKEIIGREKYFPRISELIEECRFSEIEVNVEMVERLHDAGKIGDGEYVKAKAAALMGAKPETNLLTEGKNDR